MKYRAAQPAQFVLIALLVGIAGCAALTDMLNTLFGEPEPVPPLGQQLATPSGDAGGVTDWDDVGSEEPLNPAASATAANLAGIWVHGEGYGAIHINASGAIYQVDLADQFAGQPLPSFVPPTLYNVGSASVDRAGQVTASLQVSLAGLTASATLSGLLDESFNVIFNVVSHTSVDLGSGPETSTDSSPWYRWDPATGTFPGL